MEPKLRSSGGASETVRERLIATHDRSRSGAAGDASIRDRVCGRTYRRRHGANLKSGAVDLQEVLMPRSDTGERVTEVLESPSRDGLSVQAIRVDYEPGGFSRGTHRHPAGAHVYVMNGSVEFAVGDGKRIVLEAGESFYEPPNALHAVSRNASEDVPASLIAFFVLRDGESATVYDHD
jgi:quercetin dioxygenase-like cupin family protein